jgi:hypothetical protein
VGKARRREQGRIAAPARSLDPRIPVALAAAALVVLACHTFGPVVSGTGVSSDSDVSFHAWRVVRAVSAGTVLPLANEPFENFPEGGRAVWPPLHDASLAALARLGGSSAGAPAAGLPAASAFPVIELLASLLLAAWIASRGPGTGAAAMAAWCVALTPYLLRRGAFGEIDHNTSEVMFALALAAAAFVPWDGLAVARPPLYGLLWAALLLTGLGFFPGIVVGAALVSLGVVLADFPEGGNRAATISAGFLLGALALPWLAAMRVPPDPGDPWRLGPVYVLVLAGGAMATGAAGVLARRGIFRGWRDGIGAVSFLGGAAIWLASPAAARLGLFHGFLFVGAQDPWLATIEEFQSVVHRPDLLRLSLPAVAVALVGVAGAAFFRVLERRHLVVLVPLAGYLGLALAQRRFLAPAIAFSAVSAGLAYASAPKTFRRVLLATLGLGALVVAPVYGGFFSMYSRGMRPPPPEPADVAAELVARSTPAPGAGPSWGVLAPWSYGHRILFLSGRPVCLNNFGNFHGGFDRAMGVLIEPSPARGLRVLREMKVRYVLTARAPLHIPTIAAALGDDPARFYDDLRADSLLASGPVRRPGFLSLLHRLQEQDARPLPTDRPADREALSHFVLVDQSAQTYPAFDGRRVAFLRLWEVR